MTPWLDDGDLALYHGGAETVLATLPAGIAQTCVTSPPYWGLRDYGTGDQQLGLEATPDEYVARLVAVFRMVRRVLRDDGTVWLNLGDSYAGAPVGTFNGGGFKDKSAATGGRDLTGHATSGRFDKLAASGLKPKDLVGIPWRVAFALQTDGWYLRSSIIWAKPNPMPESVTDRPTTSHEYVFLLAKRASYYYDADAIREPHSGVARMPGRPWLEQTEGKVLGRATAPNGGLATQQRHEGGRNVRSVWEIATQPTPEAHFATFPEELVRRCILAGSRVGDTVLDPFIGSGTTALVARKHGRRAVGIDLNEAYLHIAARRTSQLSLLAKDGAT